MDKLLARLRIKRRKSQINKIRNEREHTIIEITEIQRIVRDYYELLHSTNWITLKIWISSWKHAIYQDLSRKYRKSEQTNNK